MFYYHLALRWHYYKFSSLLYLHFYRKKSTILDIISVIHSLTYCPCNRNCINFDHNIMLHLPTMSSQIGREAYLRLCYICKSTPTSSWTHKYSKQPCICKGGANWLYCLWEWSKIARQSITSRAPNYSSRWTGKRCCWECDKWTSASCSRHSSIHNSCITTEVSPQTQCKKELNSSTHTPHTIFWLTS